MKKHIFTLLFAVFYLSLSAQQLPNNGFETWTQASNPDGWNTFASGVVGTPYAAGAAFVQPAAAQQSPGMVGGSSIRLRTIDVSATLGSLLGISTVPGAVGLGPLNTNALSTGDFPFIGTAFPYRPDTLFFAYAYTPTHPDSTAKLELAFLRGGNIVAQGFFYLLDSSSTPGLVYIPIDDWDDACPADTLILNFMSSSSMSAANVGSTLFIDTVFFSYSTPPTLPTVTIAASQSTVSESVGTVTYTATLSAPNPCGAISIPVTFSGTATSGTDYSTSGTSFNFPIGATTATITVTINDDTNVEASETIIATLGASPGVTLGAPSNATITITDNDVPTISLSANPTSIPENGGVATFTATLSQAAFSNVTFGIGYTGTATMINDYNVTSSTTTIPAGSLTATVSIATVNDVLIEGDETIIAELTANPVGATLGSTTTATVIIVDDDFAPSVSLSASPTSIMENGGTSATITATLSSVTPANVLVNLTYGGSAVDGTDYTSAPTSINIPAGSTTGSVSIAPINNAITDGNRTVTATIISVSPNATVGTPDNATVTIVDDDTPPTVTIAATPTSILENGGVSTITATLSHSYSSDVTVTITYGGDAVNGTDYTSTTTTLLIPAGSTSGTVTITAVDNALIDGTRTVIATASVSSNAVLGSPSTVTIAITDDDTPPNVSIAVTPTTISENGGVSTITATLSHVYSSDVTITVTYIGTLVNGVDYTGGTTITVPAGSLSGSTTVTGIDNSAIDGNRTIIATFSATPSASSVSPTNETITITDDDTPEASISVDNMQILETGGSATVTISLSRPNPLFPVTANLIYGGSATYSTDYSAPGSVVIPAGSTSTSFVLSSLSDTDVEGNESVVITISNASNGTIIGSPSTAMVVILDDDTAAGTPYLTLEASTPSVTEGGTVTLTAKLSVASSTPVTATINFTGTAVIPNDFSASATTVSIPAGALTATVILTTVDDIYYEGTRIIFASLTEVSGDALIGQPATASISLLDNENSTAPPPPPPVLPTDPTSGIMDVNILEAIKVYPIPARDFVKIAMSVDIPQIVTLVDMQGRIVKEVSINSGENTIDLSDVNSGNYILRFTNEQFHYFSGAKPIIVIK